MSADKKKPRGTLPGQIPRPKISGLSLENFARGYRRELLELWNGLDLHALSEIAHALTQAQDSGRQVFIAGNGGSAATASHMATDFSKTAARPGKPLMRCISITENTAFITATANDISYDEIFVRQLENLIGIGDVLILISGSGNSKNLLQAAAYARGKGALTIGLLGFDGGELMRLVDIPLLIPSGQYGIIEDMHLSVGHILTFYWKQRK